MASEVMQLDNSVHPADASLLEACSNADPSCERTVKEARAMGIPFVTILGLIIQYGPKFVQVLQEIMAALKTPPPAPPAAS
jgi:hypothetical protein